MKIAAGALLLLAVVFLFGSAMDMYFRKAAAPLEVRVSEVLCKHKWAKGSSTVRVIHEGRPYSVRVTRAMCGTARIGAPIRLYYNAANDHFYPDNEVKYRLLVVALAAVLAFGWLFLRTIRAGAEL